MPNPVLERLTVQRAEAVSSMDAILNQVGEDRDLVESERQLLNTARDRLAEIDAQITPLAEYEQMRAAHTETLAGLGQPAQTSTPRRAETIERAPAYNTAGSFLVDYLRANGIMERNQRDEAAAQRIYQARADQTTADTPGILPTPIVGQVLSLVDANRPLIVSLGGARALGAIPGKTFTRPTVSQHVTVGPQSAEKTALPSQKMSITSVTFTKVTHGGYVDISRQDIDWTSPAAWDILVRDLAENYATDTESTVAGNFVTSATGTKPPALPATPVLADWTKALYTAAMHSYQAGLKMPDRIWCSLDVWAALGSLVDTQRTIFPVNTTNEMNAPGTSSLADFRGDILGLPRIVVPKAPAKTCIVGPSDHYEVYEEVIGLLSVVEPSILGVQVAYGGYLAFGSLHPTSYVALDLSAVTSLPTAMEAEADTANGGNGGTSKSSK